MGSILWDQLCSWSCFTVYCFFFYYYFFLVKIIWSWCTIENTQSVLLIQCSTMISSCNWPIPTFTSQHSRPLNTNGLCSEKQSCFSLALLFWYIQAWETKWKVKVCFCVHFHVTCLTDNVFVRRNALTFFYAYFWWRVFRDGDTERYSFSVHFIPCVLFWCNLTKIFCWGNSRIFQRKPEKLIFPLSEKSSSWEQEPHKFKLKSMLLFLTKRRGKHWVDLHCCKLYLNV